MTELIERKKPRSIKETVFKILSSEDILENFQELKLTGTKKKEILSALNGTQLGATEDQPCTTCQKGYDECFGHSVYIKLTNPVINPHYSTDAVVMFLNFFCLNCKSPRFGKDYVETNFPLVSEELLTKIYKEKIKQQNKNAACWNCHTIYPKVTLDKSGGKSSGEREYMKLNYVDEDGNKKDAILSTKGIIEHFKKIKDDDLKLMGFNNNLHKNPKFIIDGRHIHKFRPENMIMEYLLISSHRRRPLIFKNQFESPSQDHLTELYQDIIRKNLNSEDSEKNKPKKGKKKATPNSGENAEKTSMRSLIKNLFEGTKPDSKPTYGHNSEQKGIGQRMSGKDGYIGANITGKRDSGNGRAVVIASPYHISEIGIPVSFTKVLTVRERIFSANIDYVKKLILEKKVESIIRKNEKTGKDQRFFPEIFLRKNQLKIGDEYNRYILEGDMPIVNRQPTLRIESIMAFKVKFDNRWAIGLPPPATTPFNAD